MKTTILKMMVLPAAAFFLASAAAVATDKSSESKALDATIMAYIHDPNINSCKEVTVDCSPGGGLTCLSGSWTAFAKDTPVSCNGQLHRPN